MKRKEYKWKIPSFAKEVEASIAVKELKRIERKYGSLNPVNLLNSAKSEKSIFHSLFEWDDSKAAEQYRLSQARTIINNVEITIISDGEEYIVPVYEMCNVPDVGRGYKHIETFTVDDVSQVKQTTIEALQQLTKKLQFYKQFDKVVEHIHSALLELQS